MPRSIELFEARAEADPPGARATGSGPPGRRTGERATPTRRSAACATRRAPAITISEALLDQRALAGIGNIWRNETLHAEQVSPWARVGDLDDATLGRLVATARRLLRQSVTVAAGRAPMAVYRRAGRPCRRCGTLIRSAPMTNANPRIDLLVPHLPAGSGRTVSDARVRVRCAPVHLAAAADGWVCGVVIDDGSRDGSRHEVSVRAADLDRLAPGATDPTDLVRRSFAFLVEREPPESILRSFDLPMIGRYFPDYEIVIRRLPPND